MKYQRLSKEELENLKDDFIRFLASQGIDAEAWTDLKQNKTQQAEGIIDVYSDLVYEQALSKCVYLEHLSAKEFKAIHFTDTHAHVIGLKVAADADINLNTPQFQDTVQAGLKNNQISIFTATKAHDQLREQEMFSWLKKGAYMANDLWYTQMKQLV